MRKIFSKNSGFTIVEMMVAMAIIFIISAMVAANYHLGNRQIVLDNQAAQFAQDVRRVQEWALSSRETAAGDEPAGYGIYVPETGDCYILYADKDSSKDYTNEEEVEKVFLNNKIEISNISLYKNHWNYNIPFVHMNYAAPDLSGRISKGGDYDWAKITFRVIGGSETRVAAANIAGLVYVE